MAKGKIEGSGIPHYLATLARDSENIRMTANNGYVIAPQKIIRCFRLNDIEKLLLLEIISYMGENDYAFPSHKRLAFKLGKKSTASVKTTLNSLRDKGFIDWNGGGGDLGTNRYFLKDLYSNPYLIMSEFTHFFAEEVLSIHRGEISYEAIYSTILDIVEKPKNMRGADDSYGICIDWLFKDISLKDRIDMYWVFGDILHHKISLQSNITINFDTYRLVTKHFKKFHPSLEIENEDDHPILDVLKNPYFEQPFEVKIEGISGDEEEILHDYYDKVWSEMESLDEKEIYRIFIENVIMPCPSGTLSGNNIYTEFMMAGDLESRINLVKEVFPYPQPKYILSYYLMELKIGELRGQQV